jgi:hypothetical protein
MPGASRFASYSGDGCARQRFACAGRFRGWIELQLDQQAKARIGALDARDNILQARYALRPLLCPDIEIAQIGIAQRGDGRPTGDVAIVEDDAFPVAGQLHIELGAVIACASAGLERRKRVLRPQPRPTPMRNVPAHARTMLPLPRWGRGSG